LHSATERLLAPTPAQANQQQLQAASLRSAAEAAGLTKRRKKRRVVYVDDDDNIIGEEDEDEDVTDGPAFSLTIGEEGTVRRGCSSWGHGAAIGLEGLEEGRAEAGGVGVFSGSGCRLRLPARKKGTIGCVELGGWAASSLRVLFLFYCQLNFLHPLHTAH